jgi:hypothetical protein
VSNELKGVASVLASKGRYGDTVLAHINPVELEALRKLSPTGKLTVNPDTGLPEAFLPMLLPLLGSIGGGLLGGSSIGAGIGLTATLGSAIGAGLGSYAATGDLGKGIMSGMMGYGIGSAMSGLAGMAGGAAEGAGAALGSQTGSGLAATAAGSTAAEAASPFMASAVAEAAPAAAASAPAAAAVGQGAANAASGALNAPAAAATPVSDMFGQYGKALEGLKTPGAAWEVFGKNASKTTIPIGMGLYSMMGDSGSTGSPKMPTPQERFASATTAGSGRKYLGAGRPSAVGKERQYFGYQEGGKVKPRAGLSVPAPKTSILKFDDPKFNPDKEGRGHARMDMYGDSIVDYNDMPTWNQRYDEDRAARRNQEHYSAPSRRTQPKEMSFEGGGYVGGPGGGLDDAIPAIIDGRAPAALSSGEYVVPAHAVSGLGDGSTEAGVAKLDAMVDGVMKHKFGSTNRKPAPMAKMGGQGARPFAGGGRVKKFDPEGDDYDYDTARDAGIGPGEDGHWASRDPRDGKLLKGRKHPTFDKGVDTDRELGYGLQKQGGRYYTVPFARGGLVPSSLMNLMEGRGSSQDMLQAYLAIMDDEPRRPMGGLNDTLPMPVQSQPIMQQAVTREPEPEADPDLEDARARISRVESGGNYKALGPMVGKDRAYGKYQVMGANIPSWTKEALGKSLTADEYLADQKAQDAVFNHRFGGYMKKYGAKGAARAWFAGEGGMNNRGAKDVLGTSVDAYERKFAG